MPGGGAVTGLRHRMPYNPDPGIGSLPDRVGSPRCGRVMHRYEAVWGAMFDDPVCGRPEGHTGVCRSVQSLERAREADRERWPAANARKRAERAARRALG